jgi:hypothetical protein
LHVFCTLSRSQLFLLRGSYTYRSTGVCLMRSPTLARFAEPYRLRLKRDNCGESIINGKFGHLYEHAAGLLGLVLEESRNGRSKSRSLLARRRKASAAGFRVHQAGEVETILLFEVGNLLKEKLAIRLVAAKRRRVPSSAQLETLRRAREALRFCKIPAQGALQGPRTHAIGGTDVGVHG